MGDIYYFRRWYNELDTTSQNKLKSLVSNGQWEIVHGGAVSTDEAAVNYHDIIDNMMAGRTWIKREFDVVPKVGW